MIVSRVGEQTKEYLGGKVGTATYRIRMPEEDMSGNKDTQGKALVMKGCVSSGPKERRLSGGEMAGRQQGFQGVVVGGVEIWPTGTHTRYRGTRIG